MISRPLFIMFIGIPGSGKTYFAKQLAKKLGAVTFNSDATRLAIWGSREAVHSSRPTPELRALNNRMTFGAMGYMASQVLDVGYSVVYDCNANKQHDRKDLYALAKSHGAVAVTIRLQVPYEVSLTRVQQRDDSSDQLQFSEEEARKTLERFTHEIEEPKQDECVVFINGELPFAEQFETFQNQLNAVQ